MSNVKKLEPVGRAVLAELEQALPHLQGKDLFDALIVAAHLAAPKSDKDDPETVLAKDIFHFLFEKYATVPPIKILAVLCACVEIAIDAYVKDPKARERLRVSIAAKFAGVL